MKKIVIVGAGYAGVLTAKHLEKKLRKNPDVEITIIDKNSFHTMLTELHEVAAGRVSEESIKMQLSDIFAHRNVNVVLDEVGEVDFDNKVVKGKNDSYDYDYLVIATGCKPTYFGTPGAEFTFPLWSYENAVALNTQILECFRKASCTSDPVEKKKLLTFSVVGSGFTGVEMAGELGEYKDELCQLFEIDKSEVTINIIDVAPHVLPIYPDHLVKKVEWKFSQLGVTIKCGTPVAEVGQDYVKVGDEVIGCYTTIWAAGVEGSKFVDENKAIKQEGRGRFATNEYLQSVDKEDVYVVGDNIFYIPEGHDAPVPQMVENAEHSSTTVAKNIIATMNNQPLHEYKPKFNGSMVCVGGKWGVAYVGNNPNKMFSFSSFPAMFIKHFINIIYFLQVLGLHKVYSYARHEFFRIKNNRSCVGGHFSNVRNAPTIFLVPLRVFLGCMWLFSGIAKLPGLFSDWTKVTSFPSRAARYGSSGGGDTTSGATDAVAGAADAASSASNAGAAVDAASSATDAAGAASGAVESAGSGAMSATQEVANALSGGFDGVAHWFGQTFEFSASNPSPTFWIFDSIMNWAYETFFWSGETGFTTLAAVFQAGMIWAEIIVGILFIIGLLTPVAAVVSFVMTIAIWMSGWSYMSIFFYGFAGLACMFAGNSIGVDYYFLPWLDRKLKTWRWTKKWYLYFRQ